MSFKFKIKLGILFLVIVMGFNFFIYTFDKIVTPVVLTVADGEIRAKATEIINACILEEYSKSFEYEEIIKIEKDELGNIVLLRADTLKLSKIAADVAIKSQKKLRDLGNAGIKLPMGYILKNNVLAYFGPSITIKMQPIGYIETKYSSEFETAGINQTRHKLYVEIRTHVRVIIPLKSNDIEIKNEIPIFETIIVGKVPDNAINLDMNNAGSKIPNK
jgi:sporulation protein YunB